MLVKRKVRGRISRRRKKNKTKVIQTEWGTFDSEDELKRWQQLLTWEDEGRITDLKRGEPMELQPGFRDAHGKKWRAWTYTPDFTYVQNGITIVEDFKGMRPNEWSIKERRIRYKYPDMHFFVNESITGEYEPPA